MGGVAYLTYTGLGFLAAFHPRDPARWIFVLPVFGLAAMMALVLALIPVVFCSGRVRLDLGGVHYDPGWGRRRRHYPWTDLLVQTSLGEHRPLRRLILMRRSTQDSLVFYDLFLPQFDDLAARLVSNKQRLGRPLDTLVSLD